MCGSNSDSIKPLSRPAEDGTMGHWKKAGLIGLGAVLGVLLSLNFSAIAQRDARMPIPYEDLQLLSAVFGKIKSDYVEPVSDDKLIKEAINGMVHGLDPHSDFLDADGFKDLQISTQGKFGGLGIESVSKMVLSASSDRGHARVRADCQAT
jgi:C-terminal processing protease CtpA/Prc